MYLEFVSSNNDTDYNDSNSNHPSKSKYCIRTGYLTENYKLQHNKSPKIKCIKDNILLIIKQRYSITGYVNNNNMYAEDLL